jgi:hypothetical protein
LLAHGFAEAAGSRDHGDLLEALLFHVLEDLGAGHLVGVRHLEDHFFTGSVMTRLPPAK